MMIDKFDLQAFIDYSLEKISKNSILSLGTAEKHFLDQITPHMDRLNPLAHVKFDPELIPYLFKGWKTGSVYSLKGQAENAVYQVIKTDSEPLEAINIIFWLKEDKSEFRMPANQIDVLPTNMSDFVKKCYSYDIILKLKEKPYQQ